MAELRLLRPMRFGELVDEAFDFYKCHFPLLAGIAATFYVREALLQASVSGSPALTEWVYWLTEIPRYGGPVSSSANWRGCNR